jgi:hypothetical protein
MQLIETESQLRYIRFVLASHAIALASDPTFPLASFVA